MIFNRFLFSVFILLFAKISAAQFISAEVGVSGLTCSACTRSVEMSIRKLDFVKDVQMNLEHTNGKIIFKENSAVNIEKVARAVENAGFSVSYLNATVRVPSVSVSDNSCFTLQGAQLQFVKVGSRTLSGDVTLKFLGKQFMLSKELKTWNGMLVPLCFTLHKQTYFVTI